MYDLGNGRTAYNIAAHPRTSKRSYVFEADKLRIFFSIIQVLFAIELGGVLFSLSAVTYMLTWCPNIRGDVVALGLIVPLAILIFALALSTWVLTTKEDLRAYEVIECPRYSSVVHTFLVVLFFWIFLDFAYGSVTSELGKGTRIFAAVIALAGLLGSIWQFKLYMSAKKADRTRVSLD